ncbi:MAG: glutaminyl-peptide cyclotransferase [Candidatus Kapaibacteriales bacterium]
MHLLLFLLLLLSCADKKPRVENPKVANNLSENSKFEKQSDEKLNTAPVFSIKVIRTIPHDSQSFTQGLLFYNGLLYESSGQYGKSKLFTIDPKTGRVIKSVPIESEYFAEGIALFRNKIYMLTWQNEVCIVFNANSLERIAEFSYSGEGWGLTNFDDNYLIQSDGTNALKIIDPNDFKTVSTIFVTDGHNPIANLNELESINNDEIWANIWGKDLIACIDKKNGKVRYWVDLSSLRSFVPAGSNIDVLNGIAFDRISKKIFLTGKYWHYIFEVELAN